MTADQLPDIDPSRKASIQERKQTFSRRGLLALSIPAGVALTATLAPRVSQADIIDNHTDHSDHADHSDSGHCDLQHADNNASPIVHLQHGDSTMHTDLGIHADTHVDFHFDHTDDVFTGHADEPHCDHTDPVPHGDSTAHGDHNDVHNDDRGDIPHYDQAHGDASHNDGFGDIHYDWTGPHTDGPIHIDGHSDFNDTHADGGLGSHTDSAHEDTVHYDHTDHTDVGS